MMKKTLIAIIILLLLSACKIDVSGMLEQIDTFKVHVYEAGRPVKEYIVVKGDEKHKKLMQWAKENGSGWQMTPATYIPGILVSGGRLSINFLGTSVIFNGPDGQYAKDTNPADYAFFK